MNETPNTNTQGTNGDPGKTSDPIAELRARHADAVSGRKEARGVKPGAQRGPYKKGSGSPGGAPASAAPGPAALPPPSNESLNKKMGSVWRAVGYGLGLGTNCNVWFLDAEQEKLLGEAYGDLCTTFGIGDTLAFKVVFCIGTTIGVMGTKAFAYSAYKASLLADEEKRKKDLKGQDAGKGKENPAPGQDLPPFAPPTVHESKPGTL